MTTTMDAQPLIDELFDYDDPLGSETRLRAAANGDLDLELVLQLRTQVARSLGLQGRFADAATELDAVAGDLMQAGATSALATGPVRVRLSLERGRLLNSAGSSSQACPHFEQAFNQARLSGLDFLAADAAHMLAIAAPVAEHERWAATALEIATTSRQPRVRRWASRVWNNLGWTRMDLDRPAEALEAFEHALVERQREGTADGRRPVQIAAWCVARALRELGRLDEALAIQERLAEELVEDGISDEHVVAELRLLRAARTNR